MSRIASWLLNGFYLLLILAASPWILWSALRQGKYREGFAEKLLGCVPRRQSTRPCLWLHAVSVGEVNLLSTIIEEVSRRDLKWDLVISTTTKTGYDLACRKYADHTVFYCPLDFTWAVQTAMRRIRPDLLVLAELELWPNLIRAAKNYGAKVAIVNGRLGDRSFRGYHRFRWIVGRVLRNVDVIAAQNEEIAERFRALGADPSTVVCTGSLKFDGAQTDRDNPKTRQLRQLANISSDDCVLLAGSTQAPEEEYVIELFRQLQPGHPNLRLVIVPRHPQRFDEVADLLQHSGLPHQRRSQLNDSATRIPNSAILLVDTIGELGAWWGTAAIGFVGGTFGSRGGQNMLEPAAYGVATCFGPNTWNFRDIVAHLRAADAVVVVENRQALAEFVQKMLTHPAEARRLGQRAHDAVLSQQGATARTVDLLEPLVPTLQHSSRAA